MDPSSIIPVGRDRPNSRGGKSVAGLSSESRWSKHERALLHAERVCWTNYRVCPEIGT